MRSNKKNYNSKDLSINSTGPTASDKHPKRLLVCFPLSLSLSPSPEPRPRLERRGRRKGGGEGVGGVLERSPPHLIWRRRRLNGLIVATVSPRPHRWPSPPCVRSARCADLQNLSQYLRLHSASISSISSYLYFCLDSNVSCSFLNEMFKCFCIVLHTRTQYAMERRQGFCGQVRSGQLTSEIRCVLLCEWVTTHLRYWVRPGSDRCLCVCYMANIQVIYRYEILIPVSHLTGLILPVQVCTNLGAIILELKNTCAIFHFFLKIIE